jgi:hypothetical protein
MSVNVDPHVTRTEKTAVALMFVAFCASLLIFGAWIDAANERGSDRVAPIHHKGK